MEKVLPSSSNPRQVRIVAFRTILLAAADRLKFSKISLRPKQVPGSTAAGREAGSSVVPELSYDSGAGEVKVVISSQALQALVAHCGDSNSHGREVGGILVGYRYERSGAEASPGIRYYATLTDLIPVQSLDSSEAHVRFDESAWELVDQQMAERFTPEGKCRLGWYHTHPSQGIFFSGQDRDAHTVFQQPHQFALVIDPRVMEGGLFYWTDYEARTLAGPLRFSLTAPASPERTVVHRIVSPTNPPPPLVAPRSESHPFERKLHRVRFAAFWALGGLLSGYVAGRSGQDLLPPWHAFVLAVMVLIGLWLWKLGFFHPRMRIVGSGTDADAGDTGQHLSRIPRGVYASVPAYAIAVLAIFLAVHYAARRIPIPARPASGATRSVDTAKTSALKATIPSPAPAQDLPVAAAVATKIIRLFVRDDGAGRDGSRRIALESRQPRAKVTYSIRNCQGSRGEPGLAACRISTRESIEDRFFEQIFHWHGPQQKAESVKALQLALGLPDPPDGQWGSRSRAAWLDQAVNPYKEPLHVSLPGSKMAAVVFEKE